MTVASKVPDIHQLQLGPKLRMRAAIPPATYAVMTCTQTSTFSFSEALSKKKITSHLYKLLSHLVSVVMTVTHIYCIQQYIYYMYIAHVCAVYMRVCVKWASKKKIGGRGIGEEMINKNDVHGEGKEKDHTEGKSTWGRRKQGK